MENELVCAICLDIATDAVETKCCHHIYCQVCIAEIKLCPHCRAFLVVEPSFVIRRLIGNLKTKCPNDGCGSQITRSNLRDHLQVCNYGNYECPAPDCQYSGIKLQFCQHMVNNHSSALVKGASRLFEPAPSEKKSCTIEIQYNSRGREARLGYTGKYYCRGETYPKCQCCNGYCGPGNGCNCGPCMKLDVTSRDLPRGWYVNRDGGVCRRGTNNRMYCGRKMAKMVQNCDGWCGPTNGPSCEACNILMNQLDSRYASVWC